MGYLDSNVYSEEKLDISEWRKYYSKLISKLKQYNTNSDLLKLYGRYAPFEMTIQGDVLHLLLGLIGIDGHYEDWEKRKFNDLFGTELTEESIEKLAKDTKDRNYISADILANIDIIELMRKKKNVATTLSVEEYLDWIMKVCVEMVKADYSQDEKEIEYVYQKISRMKSRAEMIVRNYDNSFQIDLGKNFWNSMHHYWKDIEDNNSSSLIEARVLLCKEASAQDLKISACGKDYYYPYELKQYISWWTLFDRMRSEMVGEINRRLNEYDFSGSIGRLDPELLIPTSNPYIFLFSMRDKIAKSEYDRIKQFFENLYPKIKNKRGLLNDSWYDLIDGRCAFLDFENFTDKNANKVNNAYKTETRAIQEARRVTTSTSDTGNRPVGIITNSLASYLLFETMYAANQYSAEQQRRREYERNLMEIKSRMGINQGATSVEMRAVVESIVPEALRMADIIPSIYLSDCMNSLEELEVFNYKIISESHRMRTTSFGITSAMEESEKLINKENYTQNDLLEALIKCPYNPDVYVAFAENGIGTDMIIECAYFFGFLKNKAKGKECINRFVSEMKVYYDRCQEYESAIENKKEEMNKVSEIRFITKNRMQDEYNNLKAYYEKYRNRMPILRWE